MSQTATVNAPDFPAGLEWLNTERPLKLADLRGKVVLLDFWTYCCINCMHVIPDLKRLEAQYGDALVVIGVHSAKFTTEQQTDNIRQAILRYGLEHPVINDSEFRVWNEYTVRAWPTLVLIDSRGKIRAEVSGEGAYDNFAGPIADLIAEAKANGTLNLTPIPKKLERDTAPSGLLSFPGKVLADPKSDRLFIADSSHDRIVVARRTDGSVVEVIGSGQSGTKDGAFESACFYRPQGMALDGDWLYIADTENHTIRRANLKTRTVETVAGNGTQARTFNVGGVGIAVPLNSPWDLAINNGSLFIAMAGSHQIWKMDLATLRIDPYAGTAAENRVDGPLNRSALAQPSGIASDGTRLYVADSEVSSIRTVDLDPSGRVGTVVGEALFEFGDIDGTGDVVRLQHPLGVAFGDGSLFVADTYNNKIKRIDPAQRSSATFAGTGRGGFADGAGNSAQFDEPGGLSIADGKIYVADTNNHAVRVVDIKTRQVDTLSLKHIAQLAKPAAAGAPFHGQIVDLAAQQIAPGDASVLLDVTIPRRFKLNTEAPFFAGINVGDARVVVVPQSSAGVTTTSPVFPLKLPFEAHQGKTDLMVDAAIYYCETGKESLCYVKQIRFRIPLTVQTGGGRDVRILYELSVK